MKTKEVKMVPYMLVGYCEECGGELEPTGTVFLTYPAIYEYRCKKCGHVQESETQLNEVYYKAEAACRKKK